MLFYEWCGWVLSCVWFYRLIFSWLWNFWVCVLLWVLVFFCIGVLLLGGYSLYC